METFNRICISVILGTAALGLLAVVISIISWAVVTLIDYYRFLKRLNEKEAKRKE